MALFGEIRDQVVTCYFLLSRDAFGFEKFEVYAQNMSLNRKIDLGQILVICGWGERSEPKPCIQRLKRLVKCFQTASLKFQLGKILAP